MSVPTLLSHGLGRRQVLCSTAALGALCVLAPGQLPALVSGEAIDPPLWTAVATFVRANGRRVDPARWPRGDSRLARSARVTVLGLEDVAHGSAPEAIDLDVPCGSSGQHRFMAWSWRKDAVGGVGRSVSFVAPVCRHRGLQLDVSVDHDAQPLAVHLHPGKDDQFAKLRPGEYDLDIARGGEPRSAARLRIAIDLVG